MSPEALEAWIAALGPTAVLTAPEALERYARTTATQGTAPAAILLPQDATQVQRLVEVARRHRLPLYPISRGRNWGYGDACAPTPGQIIVDLSRMNRIVEVNDRLAYAVIEPGVTQGQLADHLRAQHPDLWLDCTGATVDASVVGNTVDRGFGHTPYADHLRHTCGMEIVLADGRLLRTGFGHLPNAQAQHVYPHGIGPALDGIFSQSNFGIITRIGLWLMPRPQAVSAFFFKAGHDDDLGEVIDRLAPLRLQGLVRSAVHVGNDLRVLSGRLRYPFERAGGRTPLPGDLRRELRREHGLGAWNGAGAIYGTPAMVRALRREVRRALAPYRPRFIDQRSLPLAQRLTGALARAGIARSLAAQLRFIEPIWGLLTGRPSDDHMTGVAWRVRGELPPGAVDPLDLHAGLLWVSPVLPIDGQSARQVMDLVAPLYERFGFDALATFTLLNERSMVCVTNLAFDQRQPREVEQARACYDQLLAALLAAGYAPYRAHPAAYPRLWDASPVFWDVARALKQALDPLGIIAPGRYVPPAP